MSSSEQVGIFCKETASKPQEPLPGDCCGSGCTPCVYDTYLKQLEEWKIANRKCASRNQTRSPSNCEVEDSPDNHLSNVKSVSREHYQPFEVIGIEKITKDCFTVHIRARSTDCELVATGGRHLQLRHQIGDQESVIRPYTPVLLEDGQSDSFSFFIKTYDDGKMSLMKWQHVNIGDELELRGPWGGFDIKAHKMQTLLLLAAGTGLAPLYQMCHEILRNEADETVIHLFYSAPTAACFFAKERLDEFNSYWNFHVTYFITQADENELLRYQDKVIRDRIDLAAIRNVTAHHDVSVIQVLICGTDSFCVDMKKHCQDVGFPLANVYVF